VGRVVSMRLHRPLLATLLIAAVAASTAAHGATRPYVRCPPPETIRTAYSIERVVDGWFASIKRLFPTIDYGQGRTPPVTRATTQIREVIALNRTSKDAFAFRRLAARRCGATIAHSSWTIVANFPLAPMASTSQAAWFLVFTSEGWKLYGSVLDHN
jgi:hypothetical protein